MLQRKINFVCNMADDMVSHGSLPITSPFPAVANIFFMLEEGGTVRVSATHALAAALIAPYQDRDPVGQVYRDLASVEPNWPGLPARSLIATLT